MGGVAYVKSRTRTAIAIPIHMFGTMHASCCRHSLIFFITPSLHECQHDFLHGRHFLCALGVRTPHVVVRRRVSFVSGNVPLLMADSAMRSKQFELYILFSNERFGTLH